MQITDAVITGIGVVAANATGKEKFWNALEAGNSAAGEVKDFNAEAYLESKRLRNLDRNALFLVTAAKLALDDAKFSVTEENTDTTGVTTGTTFSHIWSIAEFDKEVFTEGLNFSNPAYFPMTVVNAASSHASIYFNIQGFNATLSTGYTSGLEALRYSINALKNQKAAFVLSAAMDTLNASLLFGLTKLGYIAGIKGPAISCPFDKRRNGPVPAEAAVVFAVETADSARKRKAKAYALIKSVASFFQPFRMGKIHPEGKGLEKCIRDALNEAQLSPEDIEYISSCANSSLDMDRAEVAALKKVFGSRLKEIPVSSVKSMLGETFSASAGIQIASCLGIMQRGIIHPTINYEQKDDACDIDCVANKSRKKQVKYALVTSIGPGGYNSACVLEKAS